MLRDGCALVRGEGTAGGPPGKAKNSSECCFFAAEVFELTGKLQIRKKAAPTTRRGSVATPLPLRARFSVRDADFERRAGRDIGRRERDHETFRHRLAIRSPQT